MRSSRVLGRKLAVALCASGLTLAAFACGSRTGLLADGPWDPEEEDSAVDPVRRLDAQVRDVQDPLPGLDAKPDVIVDQRDCRDPSETLIYVIDDENRLSAFDPRTLTGFPIGPILCPSNPGTTPFSMAVDRQGVAYVVFSDGELYRVSTRTAACAATGFQANQEGIETFGMGFASNTGGAAETLFISPSERGGSGMGFGPGELGRIGLPSYDLDVTAPFDQDVRGAELTGTGDGRLFAFYSRESAFTGTFIGQVDKDTAEIVAEIPLPSVQLGSGWAFAFWGGDFFTFSGDRGSQTSLVTRVRPSDGSVTEVGRVPGNIVGAGVSTCSPVE